MSKKNRDEHEKTGPAGSVPDPTSRWSDYFWANVIFLSFLFALLYAVWHGCVSPTDDQMPAIQYVVNGTFFFLAALLGGGFLLVTLFDAAYEFFADTAEKPLPADETPRP
jgi:hypothetical protein